MNLGTNEFMFNAANAGRKSLDLLEESAKYKQPTIGADTFNETILESKMTSDATFLAGLGKVLEEGEIEAYISELGLLLEATGELYKEVDMKPRTCSNAVDTQELTESTINEIYSKNFTDAINKDFALPLFEGTLLEMYSSEAKLLTEASIASGLSKEIDSELFLKYALFENTLVQNTFKLILPEVLEERTDSFITLQDEEYFEVFTKNARVLKEQIEESCQKMVSMIAPKLFEESTGIEDSGVEKFAGISAAIK